MSMSMITMIMMMIPTNRDPWVNWRLAPRWLTAVALPSKSPSPSNYNTGPIARHAILADFLRLFFLENALTAWSRICSGVARHRLMSQSRLVGQLLVVSSKHFYQKSVVVHHLLCNRPVHLDYPDHLQNCQTWPSFLQYVGISRWAGSFAKKCWTGADHTPQSSINLPYLHLAIEAMPLYPPSSLSIIMDTLPHHVTWQ